MADHGRTIGSATAVCLTAIALATGCSGDGLANRAYVGQPLLNLRGELAAGADTEIGGAVSLAIFWGTEGLMLQLLGVPLDRRFFPVCEPEIPKPVCDGKPGTRRQHRCVTKNRAWVSQSVSYEAEFPIQFQIPMTELPPTEVRLDLARYGGQGELAFGSLVAYIDGNGNGAFDFGSPGQGPERALAWSTFSPDEHSVYIVYLDGKLPRDLHSSLPPGGIEAILDDIPQGFSLVEFRGPSASMLPLDASLQLVARDLSEDATFQRLACAEELEYVDLGGKLPADAEPECRWRSGERRGFSWTSLEETSELCTRSFRQVYACLAPELPVPADWPCEGQ